jgi:hypothetical protein
VIPDSPQLRLALALLALVAGAAAVLVVTLLGTSVLG